MALTSDSFVKTYLVRQICAQLILTRDLESSDSGLYIGTGKGMEPGTITRKEKDSRRVSRH
jgi:hypothetical protein